MSTTRISDLIEKMQHWEDHAEEIMRAAGQRARRSAT